MLEDLAPSHIDCLSIPFWELPLHLNLFFSGSTTTRKHISLRQMHSTNSSITFHVLNTAECFLVQRLHITRQKESLPSKRHTIGFRRVSMNRFSTAEHTCFIWQGGGMQIPVSLVSLFQRRDSSAMAGHLFLS